MPGPDPTTPDSFDSDLEGQIALRRAKLEELRARGQTPYPNDFRVSHAIVRRPSSNTSRNDSAADANARNSNWSRI